MQTSQKGMRISDWQALPAIVNRRDIERITTVGLVTISEYVLLVPSFYKALISLAVQFFDESYEIRSQYEGTVAHDPSPSPSVAQNPSAHDSPSSSGRIAENTLSSIISYPEGLTVLSLLNSESPRGSQTPTSGPPPTSFGHPVPAIPQGSDGTVTFVYDQPPGEPVLWPLGSEQEAMLLQHYIEQVALFVGFS
jgi:hypothetical protein